MIEIVLCILCILTPLYILYGISTLRVLDQLRALMEWREPLLHKAVMTNDAVALLRIMRQFNYEISQIGWYHD